MTLRNYLKHALRPVDTRFSSRLGHSICKCTFARYELISMTVAKLVSVDVPVHLMLRYDAV